MKPGKAPTFADHRRADAVLDDQAIERALRCQARGCPRRWTVDDGGSLLCSTHAGKLPKDWPAITERIVWEETERARENAAAPAADRAGLFDQHPVPASPEKRAELDAWARATEAESIHRRRLVLARWLVLRERERAGEELTPYQREAWRVALHLEPGADVWARAWFEEAAAW